MQLPIRVLGKDITYKGMEISMYVDASTIKRAYPVYAVRGEGGQMYACVQDHDKSELVAFKLWCSENEIYICSEETELTKLGLSKEGVKTKNSIGFTVKFESQQAS
jgi:hypothetical protein